MDCDDCDGHDPRSRRRSLINPAPELLSRLLPFIRQSRAFYSAICAVPRARSDAIGHGGIYICVQKCGMRRCTWAALTKPAAEGTLIPMTAKLACLPCKLVLQSCCKCSNADADRRGCSHHIVPPTIPFPFRLSRLQSCTRLSFCSDVVESPCHAFASIASCAGAGVQNALALHWAGPHDVLQAILHTAYDWLPAWI